MAAHGPHCGPLTIIQIKMRYFDLADSSDFLILVMKTALEIVVFSNARCILPFCRMKLVHKCTQNSEFLANLGHLDLGNTLCKAIMMKLVIEF